MMTSLLKQEIQEKINSIRSQLPDAMIPIFDANFSVLFLNSEISFNYFALGLREVLDRTLYNLAPNEKIKEAPWYSTYEYNSEANNGITTKQRLAYILIKHNDIDAMEYMFKIQEKINLLSQKKKQLNDFVHLSHFISVNELENEFENTIKVLGDFFELMIIVQKEIDTYIEYVEDTIHDHVLNNVVDEVDQIATHYFDPDVEITNIEIESHEIMQGEVLLMIKCFGLIGAQLQYGSDIDVRDDIGLRTTISFPLEAEVKVSISTEDENYYIMSIEVVSRTVDDSSWYSD